MQNEPGVGYSNEFTRMIERVRDAGVGPIESTVTGVPMPSVRSAAMNTPPPLTAEEVAERDAKLVALGITPSPEGDPDPYGSLEAAQKAGMPVEVPTSAYTLRPGKIISVSGLPRLPDFAEIGGIDLIRGVVYLDGMEFSIPEGDVSKYRLYVLEIAHAAITQRMAEAMKLYAPTVAVAPEATDGGSDDGENVSEMS